jgi:HSP20 family protein
MMKQMKNLIPGAFFLLFSISAIATEKTAMEFYSRMHDLQQRINQLFEADWMGDNFQHPDFFFTTQFSDLKVNETNKDYTITITLPKMPRENIKVALNDHLLTIEGKSKEKQEKKDKNQTHSESKSFVFSRSISLPNAIDDQKIVAKSSKDGVLTITIPKSPHSQPREIKIQS